MRRPAPATRTPSTEGPGSVQSAIARRWLAALGGLALALLVAYVDSASALPPGYGFEKVSPGAFMKNDADIPTQVGSVRASADGSRVTWLAYAASPGDEGGTFPGQALATLGPDGWSSRGIMPPVSADEGGAAFYSNVIGYQAFDEGLAKGALTQAGPALVPGASDEQGMRNLYVRDLPGGGYSLLTPPPLGGLTLKDTLGGLGTVVYSPVVADATPDFDHVVYETNFLPLAEGAVGGSGGPTGFGVPNVYEWHDGQVRLVSVMPNGEPAPEGAVAGGGMKGGVSGAPDTRVPGDRVISDDGSHIVFTVPKGQAPGAFLTGDVYVRINGTETQYVSSSQRFIPDPAGTQPALFVTASTNGRYVFIASQEKLTDDSTARVEGEDLSAKSDLYRYDTTTEELEDLTAVESCSYEGFVGASRAGDTVYFGCGKRIYVWSAGKVTAVTGSLEGEEFESNNFAGAVQNSRKRSAVSADGRWAVISSTLELAGRPTAGTRQLYLYDRENGGMTCVSCPSQGTPTSSAYTNNIAVYAEFPIVRDYYPRNFDDAGTRLTFQTADQLTAQDRNDRVDVYQYGTDTGELWLMSQGTGTHDAYIEDVSADGTTVFFATRERLLPEDDDGLVDLYVARPGARPPAPEPLPECAGEACQGRLSEPPGAAVIGSAAISGPGNALPRRKQRCGYHGKRAAQKRGCKQRGKGKRGQRQKRHAHTNRRESR